MVLKIFTGDTQPCEAPAKRDQEAAQQLVDEYIKQTTEASKNEILFEVQPKDFEAGREILKATREQQVAIVVDAAVRFVRSGTDDFTTHLLLRFLISALLRRDLPFDPISIEQLLLILQVDDGGWHVSAAGVLRAVESSVERHGMTHAIRERLESLRGNYHPDSEYAEERKIGKRIEAILKGGHQEATQFDLNTAEAWTDALLVQLGQLDDTARSHWQALFRHSATAKSSKPSKRWLKTAEERLAPIGERAFVEVMVPCLAAIGQPGTSQRVMHGGWTHHTDPTQIHDTHADLLRGLVWATSLRSNNQLIGAVGNAAEICFKKIPNIGPRSPKIGNACLYALSEMNEIAAVAQIGRLKARAKHASVRKQLASALQRAAARLGMTEDDLEEIAVPTFGFRRVGRYEEKIGDFTAELVLTQTGRTQLWWAKPDGKKQKTVPVAIKQTHADDIKSLKRKAKGIEQLLPAQRHRIERLFLNRRSWRLGDFRKRLLDHPLMGTIARRVIWRLEANDRSANGIWRQEELVDSNDRELDWTDDETTVTIWHPLSSNTDEVLRWRSWLELHEICQPFKQAHREIYILTDAERVTEFYSNRFAAHIIRQHQFAALCNERGWRYSLEGAWDSANTPFLELPDWGVRAEFWVEAVEGPTLSEMGIFLQMSTDQLRFCRLADAQPVALVDVPALLLSEVMRDVDLFVGVSSIGNDPNWRSGAATQDHQDYWQRYAFGDLSQSAQTRKEALQRIVPRLKIADRCRFENRFLIVRGDLRTYKIHLGSGHVLASPDAKHLCIVPQRGVGRQRTDNLFLPFDGDQMLSAILSKAFLLAEDTKIKDDSILSQIRP